MTDEQIIQRLREVAAASATAAEVATVLGELCEGGLRQSTLTTYFKRAFPSIPLRTVLDAGAWHRVSDGGMTDEQFNALLAPYLADVMQRVVPPADTSTFHGLADLRARGLPERIWIVNLGATRELFLDFSELANASTPFRIEGLDEPVLTVGHLCSWMRLAGLTPPGRPVVVGTSTGRIWLVADEGPMLINWRGSSLEACFQRRAQFHELERENDFERCAAAFPALVADIVAIEPKLVGQDSSGPSYWRMHLEGIAENLGLAPFPFPWRVA